MQSVEVDALFRFRIPYLSNWRLEGDANEIKSPEADKFITITEIKDDTDEKAMAIIPYIRSGPESGRNQENPGSYFSLMSRPSPCAIYLIHAEKG
ncbi:MAG: hypothetical protein ACLQVJ_16075 [Syntrophobacteraceae bacterium]